MRNVAKSIENRVTFIEKLTFSIYLNVIMYPLLKYNNNKQVGSIAQLI